MSLENARFLIHVDAIGFVQQCREYICKKINDYDDVSQKISGRTAVTTWR